MNEDHIRAQVREALTSLENFSLEDLDQDDPRNLDPDDEILDYLRSAAYDLEDAGDKLQELVRREHLRRENILDEMPDDEYEKWKEKVYGA